LKRALVLAVVVVGVLAVPLASSAASSVTKDQAYTKARACLLKKAGASFVGRRGDGGGFAAWNRGSTKGSSFWTYKTFLRQVESVTVYFAGQPGLPGSAKTKVKACLTAGI
jgi:hypothetical protein